MPYGRKKNYNRNRHFTNPDELAVSEQKERREKEWKRKQGIEDSDSEEEETVQASKASTSKSHGAPGELPPSDSEEETDSEEEDGREHRPKGVQHLIQVENPNHVQQKSKKISSLETEESGKTQLTRKQKEDLEKQQAHARYMKAHLAGKTDEARADMARLAIIRKQREEAAKKKEEERLAQETKKKEAENKLLERKKEDKKK